MPNHIGERIKTLRKASGLSQTDMARILSLSQPAYGAIERGAVIPTAEKLVQIADALGIAPSELLGEKACPVCGFEYTHAEGLDSSAHRMQHSLAERIVRKYGFYWPYRQRLLNTDTAVRKMEDPSISMEEKMAAAENVFKALFSRSVFAYQRDDHPPFYAYVQMILRKGRYPDIPQDVFDQLVKRYGTAEGIATGTYYSGITEDEERIDRIAAKLRSVPPKVIDIIEQLCDLGQ